MGRPSKIRHEPGSGTLQVPRVLCFMTVTPGTKPLPPTPSASDGMSVPPCLLHQDKLRSLKTMPLNSPFLPSALSAGCFCCRDRKVTSRQPREGCFTPPCSSAQGSQTLRSTARELLCGWLDGRWSCLTLLLWPESLLCPSYCDSLCIIPKPRPFMAISSNSSKVQYSSLGHKLQP